MSQVLDLQGLEVGRVIDLYELDATDIGDTVYRYHNGKNELLNDVVFNGDTYTAWPVEATGFDREGDGAVLPRPTIKLANVTGVIGSLADNNEDLIGAKLTRFRIQVKYLDAVNFSGGNPDANPAERYADEIWFINRKVGHDKFFVTFELASLMDVQGLSVPKRPVVRNNCVWEYKSGIGCTYAGGPVAEVDDTPTADPNLDDCGKRVASCKLRFGAEAELPFGGFPGVGLTR